VEGYNSLLRRKGARILIAFFASFKTNLMSYTPEACPFDDWKLNEGKNEGKKNCFGRQSRTRICHKLVVAHLVK
jgi:hypothetical protein